MLIETNGIVLKTINYSETSVIAKIYTRELGLRSYIVNGVRSSKGRSKSAMLQVLNQLDLVVYERNGKDLQRIKEMKFAEIYTQIPFDITKTSIALFYAELLYKSVKEEAENNTLYDFIANEINQLEFAQKKHIADLPIKFMLQLSEYFGFYPANNYSSTNKRFDLKEGRFVSDLPLKDRILEEDVSALFTLLLEINSSNWHDILKNRKQRQTMLDLLQLYYLWHIEHFSYLRSVKVLETIF